RFTLHHRLEAPHEIGRFRLWITTSDAPTHEGLPAALLPALQSPANRRPAQLSDLLRTHVRTQDAGFLERDFTADLARKPLPADSRRAELEQDLARATRPVPIDPTLLRLRQDVDLSTRQFANKRLTAVQDLAWALINTPSFLFNR
ncbi:MAG: hypothetical protein Q7T30_01055, partial [Planctomycetota bacterium]|nr:hypothetical protein [Planctomycetota bacterium]